jgi:hypothetical protein
MDHLTHYCFPVQRMPRPRRRWTSGTTLRGSKGRLRLPPEAARTAGPPRTRTGRMNQSREAHHSAWPIHSPRGGRGLPNYADWPLIVLVDALQACAWLASLLDCAGRVSPSVSTAQLLGNAVARSRWLRVGGRRSWAWLPGCEGCPEVIACLCGTSDTSSVLDEDLIFLHNRTRRLRPRRAAYRPPGTTEWNRRPGPAGLEMVGRSAPPAGDCVGHCCSCGDGGCGGGETR